LGGTNTPWEPAVNEPHCPSVPVGQLTENETVPVGGMPPIGGLDSTDTKISFG